MNILSNKTISIGRPYKMPQMPQMPRFKTIVLHKDSTPETIAAELKSYPPNSIDRLNIVGKKSTPISMGLIRAVDESGVTREISCSDLWFKASAGDKEFPEFKSCRSLSLTRCDRVPYSLVKAAIKGTVTMLLMYDSGVVNTTAQRRPVTKPNLRGIELSNVNGLPRDFYKTIFNLKNVSLVALENVSIGRITGTTGQIRNLDLSGVNEPISGILELATNHVSIRNCRDLPRRLKLQESVTQVILRLPDDFKTAPKGLIQHLLGLELRELIVSGAGLDPHSFETRDGEIVELSADNKINIVNGVITSPATDYMSEMMPDAKKPKREED